MSSDTKRKGLQGVSFFALLAVYLFPYMFYIGATFLSGMLTLKEFFSILSFFHVVMLAFMAVLPVCYRIYFNSKIKKYDESEESINSLNRILSIF